MKVIFHPEAEQEFLDTIDYYKSQQPGLGKDYHAEIMATALRITQGPEIWPALEGDIRRCLSHRFPYGILYSVETDAICILAIMHLRRNPD